MIPAIEQIIEDVAAGVITKAQAITWLHQHAEGAANDLRDHFAGLAMVAITQASWNEFNETTHSAEERAGLVAAAAHCYADAMLKARES